MRSPKPTSEARQDEADPAQVEDGDIDLDEVELLDLRFDQMTWTGRRRLGSSRVAHLAVRNWAARGASLVDSVLEDLDVVALSAVESGWWNLEVQQSRIGSVELYLAEIGTPDGLRGATITFEQLLEIAPALAASLQVNVE